MVGRSVYQVTELPEGLDELCKWQHGFILIFGQTRAACIESSEGQFRIELLFIVGYSGFLLVAPIVRIAFLSWCEVHHLEVAYIASSVRKCEDGIPSFQIMAQLLTPCHRIRMFLNRCLVVAAQQRLLANENVRELFVLRHLRISRPKSSSVAAIASVTLDEEINYIKPFTSPQCLNMREQTRDVRLVIII